MLIRLSHIIHKGLDGFDPVGQAIAFQWFSCPRPHCDRGRRPGHVAAPNAVAAFPVRHIKCSFPCNTDALLTWFLKGGSVKRLFGVVRVLHVVDGRDFGKHMSQVLILEKWFSM